MYGPCNAEYPFWHHKCTDIDWWSVVPLESTMIKCLHWQLEPVSFLLPFSCLGKRLIMWIIMYGHWGWAQNQEEGWRGTWIVCVWSLSLSTAPYNLLDFKYTFFHSTLLQVGVAQVGIVLATHSVPSMRTMGLSAFGGRWCARSGRTKWCRSSQASSW